MNFIEAVRVSSELNKTITCDSLSYGKKKIYNFEILATLNEFNLLISPDRYENLGQNTKVGSNWSPSVQNILDDTWRIIT